MAVLIFFVDSWMVSGKIINEPYRVFKLRPKIEIFIELNVIELKVWIGLFKILK